MIKFLIVDRGVSAVPYGLDRGWTRLAAARYATPQKDDIRVVERVAEIFSTGAAMVLIRGPGFNENIQAENFEALIEQGAARWEEEDAKADVDARE
jgi:hypothetical protein